VNSEGARSLSLAQLEALRDEDLIELVRVGCREAMTPLYHRHCRLFASIAYNILQDPEEARDMVQEIFLQAFRKIQLFDPLKGEPKLWLMNIAYRLSLNRRKYLAHRRYYDKKELSGRNGNGHEPHYNPDPLEELTFSERTRIIRQGIAKLPDKQRKAIELICYKALAMKEVAARMGETPINACNHYYRGLKRLREIVDAMLTAQPSPRPNYQTSSQPKVRAAQAV
jgi:RNA polymerase sigma-70 factor (ECF subfamily)